MNGGDGVIRRSYGGGRKWHGREAPDPSTSSFHRDRDSVNSEWSKGAKMRPSEAREMHWLPARRPFRGCRNRAHFDVQMCFEHFWDDSGPFLEISGFGQKWPFGGSKSRVLGQFTRILSPCTKASESAPWQKVHLFGERGFLLHTRPRPYLRLHFCWSRRDVVPVVKNRHGDVSRCTTNLPRRRQREDGVVPSSKITIMSRDPPFWNLVSVLEGSKIAISRSQRRLRGRFWTKDRFC